VLIDDMVNQAAVVMGAAMKLNDMPMAKTFAARAPMPGSIPKSHHDVQTTIVRSDGHDGSRAPTMQAKGE